MFLKQADASQPAFVRPIACAEHMHQSEQCLTQPESRPSSESSKLADSFKLPAKVELLGQMSGSGFERQPWLVQRDSQFIQLTELLYLVLERVDGERTADEIAQSITDSTQWIVTGEQVRHVLQTKLLPLGLVIAPGTAAVPRPKERSPLAVYMRVQMLGPKWLDPITRVLRHLFHPVVLVPMLVLAAIAHWWLYRVHGLTGSLDAVLASPGGLPLLLAIVVAAGCFHEFGHAAALTYSGGKVRGMGVGLYLMYPAFYTDVTDAYRLGRWGRVRTDLGGIYFHAIACVVLIGAAMFLRQELLLPAVALINIEMMRQFIPFVRLDGYWLLADLTGVPDFFSQMGPFLRSLVGSKRLRGSVLPDLRPWVKAVFAIYILAVIPALGYFTFLMIRNLPAFLFAAVSALRRQSSTLVTLLQARDVATSMLLILTVILLLASVIGIVYLLIVTLVPPIRAGWRWSNGIPSRMVSVGAATSAMAVGIGFLWYPDAVRIHDRLTGQDRQARELLERAARITSSTRSLSAGMQGIMAGDSYTGTIALKRPNFARIVVTGQGGLGTFEVISDGSRFHRFFPAENQIVTSSPGPDGRNIRAYVADQVQFFFDSRSILRSTESGTLTYRGTVSEGGITYDVVHHVSPGARAKITRYFIARTDGTIHGVTVVNSDGQLAKFVKLTNVQRNTPIEEATFAWRPPANVRPASLPAGLSLPVGAAPAPATR
jgi:outer membrane lipoprotein-sorting protein